MGKSSHKESRRDVSQERSSKVSTRLTPNSQILLQRERSRERSPKSSRHRDRDRKHDHRDKKGRKHHHRRSYSNSSRDSENDRRRRSNSPTHTRRNEDDRRHREKREGKSKSPPTQTDEQKKMVRLAKARILANVQLAQDELEIQRQNQQVWESQTQPLQTIDEVNITDKVELAESPVTINPVQKPKIDFDDEMSVK